MTNINVKPVNKHFIRAYCGSVSNASPTNNKHGFVPIVIFGVCKLNQTFNLNE